MTEVDNGTFEDINFDVIEDETVGSSKSPDDFMGIFADFFVSINYKLIFLLFIIYLFLHSDMFVDKVLSKVKGAVDHRSPTNKGTFITGLVLVIFYMIFDMLIQSRII
jgi:hypothetical protein